MKRTIDNFFKPLSQPSVSTQIIDKKKISIDSTHFNDKETDSLISENYFDISSIVKEYATTLSNNIDSHIKHHILSTVLVPKAPFVFPSTNMNKKNLKFQVHWVEKWNWLAYSKEKDGAYCKCCVLFCRESIGYAGNEKAGALVRIPFRKWKDATEKFTSHAQSQYHKDSVVSAARFLNVMKGAEDNIMLQLNAQKRKEREENRAALRPIIETIIFCGEQELALRGDKDYGPFTLEKPSKKDGNFRALLRFRANSGDDILKSHLLNCSKNATYLSPTIQNEIIETCGLLIQKHIVNEVNNSGCFSILGDETLDVSGIEQFSLCVRYVNEVNILREDFLCFVPVHDLSANNLAEVIIDNCKKLGLDLNKLVGQGYDGAGNLAGKWNGAQALVRKKYPNALFVHCASHRLNLALSNGMSVPCVRNCMGVVKEISSLFRNNSYAGELLKKNIKNLAPLSKKNRLVSVCETRFIERHDAVIVFVELLEPIICSLQELAEMSRSISSKAATLLASAEKSYFLISLFVCENLFRITMPLSIYLQNPSHDITSAISYADNTVSVLSNMRDDVESNFKEIFRSAASLSNQIFQREIDVPRIVGRQTTRDNTPYYSSEEYYRRSVFLPVLDGLIMQITEKFQINRDILSSFEILLPRYATFEKVHSLNMLLKYFDSSVSMASVESEYGIWCERVKDVKTQGNDILEVLEKCDETFFPHLYHLLKVLATLPVTTASVERSFSTMKRVKSLPRNRTENDRLTALSLLSVHWDIPLKIDDVLDILAEKKNRKLLL